MAPPPQPKRQRLNHNPRSAPSNNASSLAHLLESVLAMSDPFIPLDLSLEQILESRVLESEKQKLIDVAFRVGSALVDAASRSSRKLAAAHNSIVWPLPPELTVKVLSFLDTASLCYASATCTTFSKCACDPLCYADIDLTRNWPKVRNSVVCTMIQRAGKNLQSLKLGADSRFDPEGNRNEPPLTRSCLVALRLDNGASGALLKKLCLHHIHSMDKKELISTLSNCKSLVDLEIVGLNVGLGGILTAVSANCRSIERLCFDYSDFCFRPPVVELCHDLINNCKMLSSLSIIGCILFDCVLRVFIKGLRKLKYADFSSSMDLKGSFLRNIGNGVGGSGDSLETLILRDCPFLEKDAIGQFFNDILAGKWKSLRLLDVSSHRRNCIVCYENISDTSSSGTWSGTSSPSASTNSGTSMDASSSSSDGVAQNGDEQNMDSSSDDQVSQNGDEQGSDSSSDDQVTQNGDEQNCDSSSDDQITQNGDEQNLDSFSDDQVHNL